VVHSTTVVWVRRPLSLGRAFHGAFYTINPSGESIPLRSGFSQPFWFYGKLREEKKEIGAGGFDELYKESVPLFIHPMHRVRVVVKLH